MTKNTKTAWIVGLGAIAALWLWARSRGTSIGSLFSFSTSSSGLGVRPAGGTGVPGVIGSIGSGRGANVVDPGIVAARGAGRGGRTAVPSRLQSADAVDQYDRRAVLRILRHGGAIPRLPATVRQ